MNAPAVSCTPEQINLQVFLLLQLPYGVSVLLLTSRCKSAAAQYECCYYLASPQSILAKPTQAKLMLYKPLFIVHGKVKAF